MSEFKVKHTGKFYQHYKNGLVYEKLGKGKMQIGTDWHNAVIYCSKDDTQIFIRSRFSFKQSFVKIKCIES